MPQALRCSGATAGRRRTGDLERKMEPDVLGRLREWKRFSGRSKIVFRFPPTIHGMAWYTNKASNDCSWRVAVIYDRLVKGNVEKCWRE